jgi:YihY family inner membrane protein
MDLPQPVRRAADVARRYIPEPLRRLATWIRSDEALSTAASLAFFALISLPPSALIGLWIVGAFAGDGRIEQLGERVATMAPGDLQADNMIVGLVDVATKLGWVSIAAALWPATAYGADLARAFDRLTPTGRRPMDGLRGRALVIVIIALLPLLVLTALMLVLFLPQVLGEDLAPRLLGYALAAVVVIAGLTGFLALLYDLFSPADVGYRAALTGGAYAAVAIAAISIGYVVYLRLGANFEERYGSSAFATVILLGLWLYLTNGALIGGYKTALMRAGVPTWEEDGS